MAAITYTKTDPQPGKKQVITWANVTESDTFVAFTFQEMPQDISIEVDGTFGGASVTMLGANSTAAVALTAMDGSTAAWTADAIFSILQRPGSLTPTAAGGSSQSLTVTMILWF